MRPDDEDTDDDLRVVTAAIERAERLLQDAPDRVRATRVEEFARMLHAGQEALERRRVELEASARASWSGEGERGLTPAVHARRTVRDETLRERLEDGADLLSALRLVHGQPTHKWMGYERLSQVLLSLRLRGGLKQHEVAQSLRSSKAQVSHLESFRRGRRPPIEAVFSWVEACGWALEWRLRPRHLMESSRAQDAQLVAEIEDLLPRLDEGQRRMVAAYIRSIRAMLDERV